MGDYDQKQKEYESSRDDLIKETGKQAKNIIDSFADSKANADTLKTATQTGKAATDAGKTAADVGKTAATAGETAATAGTAAASGAATAGVGAVVVLSAKALKTVHNKAKAEMASVSEPTNVEKELTSGCSGCLFSAFLLLIALVVCLVTPCMAVVKTVSDFFTSAGNVVTNFDEVFVNTFFPTEKREFFEELFDTNSLDVDLDSKLEVYNTVNTDNIYIYKAIIDKAIEEAFKVNIKDMLFSLDALISIYAEDYDATTSYENYIAQPYPYTLRHDDGSFYTVKDYIDGNIPQDEINNDLNYAEILSILSQRPECRNNQFSYSSFYDMLINSKVSEMLYEVDLKDKYYYKDAERGRVFGNDKTALFAEARNAKAQYENSLIREVVIPERKELVAENVDEITAQLTYNNEMYEMEISREGTYNVFTQYGNYIMFIGVFPKSMVEETDHEDIFILEYNYDEIYNIYQIIPEQRTDNSEEISIDEDLYKVMTYSEVTIYPYGLDEMYAIAEVDPDEVNHTFYTFTNHEILDTVELNLRKMMPKIDFGPQYDKKRSPNSCIVWEFGFTDALGRSNYAYTNNYLTYTFLTELWDELTTPNHNINYSPTGDSVILDMPVYINQGNYKDDYRGIGGDSIAKSGCCDCCYVMVADYYTGRDISIVSTSAEYVKKNDFQVSTFLNNHSLSEIRYEGLDVQAIVNCITEGKPVIFHFRGVWTHNGVVYHKSTRGHFIVLMGYDETGFYTFDPGSNTNTNRVIPYEAFATVNACTYRPVTTSDDFIPKYNVNTILSQEAVSE